MWSANGAVETGRYVKVDTIVADATGRYFGVTAYRPGLGQPGDSGDPGAADWGFAPTGTWSGCSFDSPTFIIRHDVAGGLRFIP